LLGRNAHKVFLSASALLDFDIEWLYDENSENIISCNISPETLDEKLKDMIQKPIAVYITSPDYIGNIADIENLAKVCHKYGILLLVDNAHGAYLKFLPKSIHPIDLGADICCDSAHKTLPTLTGGAYLHISNIAPSIICQNAMRAMGLFASTSPSYLILQSLDKTNCYLSNSYKDKLATHINRIEELKSKLHKQGFKLLGNEPLKLSISPKSYGYTGTDLDNYLMSKNIICEFSDKDNIVFMFNPEITLEQIDYFEKTILSITKKKNIEEKAPKISIPKKAITVREAMFSPSCILPLNDCLNKILASENVSCPPAIPIIVCGEIIDKTAIEAFSYYGITECRVVMSKADS